MELSSKRYLLSALKFLIPFGLLEILVFVLYFTNVFKIGSFALINIVDVVLLLIPGAYYFILFFIFKDKCKSATPKEGVISNWKSGFYRYTGSVILEDDGNEYSTAAYFASDECKKLVGKTVSYAIINDKLFIYKII